MHAYATGPLAGHTWDVAFLGKTEYEAKAAISGVTAHRQAAVKALLALRDKWGGQYKVSGGGGGRGGRADRQAEQAGGPL